MTGRRRLEKSISKTNAQKQNVINYISGVLGFYIDGRQVVEVPGKEGYVYVRVRNNLSETIKAYNEQVAPVFGLPVLIYRNKDDKRKWQVKGRDLGVYSRWGNEPYMPRHGSTHAFDGSDIVWVHSEQMLPLQPFPSGSVGSSCLMIHGAYPYNFNDEWKCFNTTGTADLLAYNPTGTNARTVLVYLDQSTNLLGYEAGSYFSESITGTCEVVNELPDLTEDYYIPIAGIRLTSTTSVLGWNNIYDVRPWITGGGSTSTGTYTTDHAALSHLDYASAGHTGFLEDTNDVIKDFHIDWGTGSNQVDSADIPDHNGHNVNDTFNHLLNKGKAEAITIGLTGGLGISWTSGEVYDQANDLFVSTNAGTGILTDNDVNYLKYDNSPILVIETTSSEDDEITIATFSVYDGVINSYRETALMNETTANTRRGLRALFPTRIISGMSVSEDTDVTNPLDVKMDAGVLYKDVLVKKTANEILSRNTNLVRHFHTGGNWDYDTNAEIDTDNYDDGNDLAAIPNNKWVKALFIYQSEKIGWIYPTAYYNTKAEAEMASLPGKPPGLELLPSLTAIVYTESAADFTTAVWQDVRAGIGTESFSGVSDHGALAGLGDEEDHPYALLHDGSRALSGAWDMGSQALTNVNIDSGEITGITDLAIADGGTAASTAADARINLGLAAGGTGDIWVEKAGDIMIGANSTTFFQIQQADTTPVFNVDTTNARVGVGINNPTFKIDTGQSTDNARIGYAEIGDWPASTTYAYFGNETLDHSAVGNYAIMQNTTGYTFINAASATSISNRINNVEKMNINNIRLYSVVDVGIQTASPGTALDVQGTGLTVNRSAIASIGETIATFTISDDAIAYIKVLNASSVDGVFAPSFYAKASSTYVPLFFIGAVTTDTGINPAIIFDGRVASAALTARPIIDFRSYGNSKMLIDASGNVGIGESIPLARCHIKGSADDQQLIIQAHSSQTANIVEVQDSSDNVKLAIAGNGLDLVLDTTTGTKIGTATNQKLGFYNATPIVQPTEITDELTTITHTAPGTLDYAIQDLTNSSPFGFVTKDEGNTVLSVIANLQTRVNELETALASLGLLADAD